MEKMTGGQAVVAMLQANGVEVVFGIPGMHNLAIYDALNDCPAIRHVVARNEQAASIMANAVGRTTGRPGVCLVTTGPAACNALVGVADGARESVPMLVVASQIASHLIGQNRGAFHEVRNQSGMFEAAGAWTCSVSKVEQIPEAINAAWVAMTHGRPRPAYVEIPHDILFATGDVELTAAPAPPRPGASSSVIEDVLTRLLAAKRPLVFVGGGATRAGAGDELRRLVERLGVPVVSTVHGKGVLPEDHPLSAGALPPNDPSCKALFAQADLLLALGVGFSEVTTAFWSTNYPQQLVHVDIDSSRIGRSVPASLGVVGDICTVLSQINRAAEAVTQRAPSPWAKTVLRLRQRLDAVVASEPGAILSRIMARVFPRDTIVCGDAANWGGWQLWHYPIYQAGQMAYPLHFGTLGYAIPGAVGAQAAFPGRRVVAACGDGGFPYGMAELATARQHNLPIIVVVANNGGYGTIRMLQENRYGQHRVIDADLLNPDFVLLARAFDCFGRRVKAVGDMETALHDALADGRPAVVEMCFPIPPTPRDYGLAGQLK